MFGSDVLDVGIGMSLLFLMMSLIATSIREAIESLMKSRAADLEKGLREMLDDRGDFQGTLGQLYKHPLISSLYRGTLDDARKGRDLPSYIPAKAFVSALFDIVLSTPAANKAAVQANAAAPADSAATKTDPATPADSAATKPDPAALADPAATKGPDAPQGNVALPQADRQTLTIESLKASADNLPPRLKSVVIGAIDDAQSDINAVRKNLEGWFDGTMDRVSGWYRRRTQLILFYIGIIAAVGLNVDSIMITQRLTADKTLREAIVATAQRPGAIPGADSTKSYDELSGELANIGYPIGWKGAFPQPQMCKPAPAEPAAKKPADAPAIKPVDPSATTPVDASAKPAEDTWARRAHRYFFDQPGCTFDLSAVPRTIAGWFVTAFAIMLGAPFWFDLLNKFMVIRSTVKPSEKSPNEASKDNPAEPAGVKLTIATEGGVSAAVEKPVVVPG